LHLEASLYQLFYLRLLSRLGDCSAGMFTVDLVWTGPLDVSFSSRQL